MNNPEEMFKNYKIALEFMESCPFNLSVATQISIKIFGESKLTSLGTSVLFKVLISTKGYYTLNNKLSLYDFEVIDHTLKYEKN